ncbi:MAG: hypothetical protein IJ276_01960 [Alphaproteobacteria bacterium]|nr:hypothetical protein [Alphaproteobacteria bacterium]
MKKVLCILPVLALAACDKPKHDLVLSCDDGADGRFLVEAKIYDERADLVITRLDRKLRNKGWLADHTWLYNQLLLIDDKIAMSLPLVDGSFEEKDHVRFEMGHNNLTGGLAFTLWHAAHNNLTMNDGEVIKNGEWMVGSPCNIVIDRELPDYGNLQEPDIKRLKNCAAYLNSQMTTETVAPGTAAYLVYDEASGRNMHISKEEMNAITNGVPIHHFSHYNIKYYVDDFKNACEIEKKLKTYIQQNIESRAIKNEPNIQEGENL